MPFCLCFLCLFIAYLHPLRFVYRILFAFFLHFLLLHPPWRMCSGKNVLLRMGNAKARVGGTTFFAEQHTT